MKLTINTAALRDEIVWAAKGAATTGTASGILSGLLLAADDNGLTVAAFDYEASRSATITDATVHADGRALAGAKILADIANRLPGETTDLVLDGTRLRMTSGAMTASLPTMPADEYPTLPAPPGACGQIDAGHLRDAVTRVVVAAGRDDTLPILTGIHLTAGPDGLHLEATDRYRIAMVAANRWTPALDATPQSLVVPAATLKGWADTAVGAVTLHLGMGAHGGDLVGLAWGGRTVTSRVVDGKYPLCRRVIDAANKAEPVDDGPQPTVITVDRRALLDAINRVRPVIPKTAPVRLAAEGGVLTVDGGGGDGRVSDTLAAEHDHDVALHFNPDYLLAALSATRDDVVRLRATAAKGPPVFIEGPTDTSGYIHMLQVIQPGGIA